MKIKQNFIELQKDHSEHGIFGAAEAKTDFDLVITKAGDKKINVIKEVRAITNLGLKEAKDLVDSAEKETKLVKEGMAKADAEKAKKLLEDAGATVELK